MVSIVSRLTRREVLLAAIEGSRQERAQYAIWRASMFVTRDLVLWGRAEYDPEKIAKRALQIFYRLERLTAKCQK